jgi:integrase
MAQPQQLTQAIVDRAVLAPGKDRDVLWDTEVSNFGARIYKSGAKSYIARYRSPDGALQTVTLDACDKLTLRDARKAARALFGRVANNSDPARERKAAKQEQAAKAHGRLRELLAADGPYARDLARRKIVNAKVVMSGLRRGLAKLMDRDVRDLTRQDFAGAITALEDHDKPGAAADLRKFARTFCDWCVGRGLATANVLSGWQRPKLSRAERLAAEVKKARALSDDEVRAVWTACAGRGSFGALVRLLLLTGARRGEIAKLERARVLSDRIVLPPLHTKMGRMHEVPLTELMRVVIAEQPHTTAALLFPSGKTNGPISGWTTLVAALRADSGVAFSLHDLRRTVRTSMSRLGVPDKVAELAIGHTAKDSLSLRYDFDQQWQARCDAFAKVSDHVARVVGVEPQRNVVSLGATTTAP